MTRINGLLKLLEEHHNRILLARSIEGIITRPQFERLWIASNLEQKQAARKIVESSDKPALLTWIKEHPSIDLGEKPIRDLYPIAKRLAIRNYSRLPREALIAAIRSAEMEMSYGA